MKIRRSDTRGVRKISWIESKRLFSNNSYFDPMYMSWNIVRVVNDDVLQPYHKVPRHLHQNFEILGYIVEGELEHEDSLGNLRLAFPGKIQHMSCGTGIFHTEKCTSDIPAKYLQIWIKPKVENTTPFYEILDKSMEFGKIEVELQNDIVISAGLLSEHREIFCNNALLYVIFGNVTGNDFQLGEGDSVEIVNEKIEGHFDGHFLLFEMID